MEEMNDKEWEYRCSKEMYSVLRSSDQFKCIVTLARIMNSINCALVPTAHYGPDEDSPEKQRQVLGSLMYLGAVLYEALLFTERHLVAHFRDNTTFKNGFGSMLSDAKVIDLRKGQLNTLRNKIVFHFDRPAVDQGVDSIDVDSVVFLRGTGQKTHSLYFQFADETTMHFLLDCPKSREELERRSKDFVDSVRDASVRFVRSASSLMDEILPHLGFEFHETGMANKAMQDGPTAHQ